MVRQFERIILIQVVQGYQFAVSDLSCQGIEIVGAERSIEIEITEFIKELPVVLASFLSVRHGERKSARVCIDSVTDPAKPTVRTGRKRRKSEVRKEIKA